MLMSSRSGCNYSGSVFPVLIYDANLSRVSILEHINVVYLPL